MNTFFQRLLAVVVGNLIVSVVMMGAFFFCAFFFVVMIVGSLGSRGEAKTKVSVPYNSFLVLNLDVPIKDSPDVAGTLGDVLSERQAALTIWEISSALRAAASDSRIGGLFIVASNDSLEGTGYGALAEVRRQIQAFAKSGKPVHAYLNGASFKAYYVASTAKPLYLHPHAILGVQGLHSQSFYLGNAFEKYGIGIQTTKVGKYKSFVEAFTSTKMSDADREQRQAYLDSIWKDITGEIALSRSFAPSHLPLLSATSPFLAAEKAREQGLVDKVAYMDEAISDLVIAGALNLDTFSFEQVDIRPYAQNIVGKAAARAADGERPYVAIVYAEGNIVDGSSGGSSGNIGGDDLAARLRSLRNDPMARAIVLRVNSPGGSAFASEVIQREMRQLKTFDKPIVVSMGTVAASGGYWISAYADHIFAERTTITGSIGVFGLMFNVKDAAGHLGVNFQGVSTAPYADTESIVRPKRADELALLQEQTDQIYSAFISKVAEGRKLPRPDVENIAEGRVWVGAAAKDIGLVDSIGGLNEAVEDAVKRAKLGKNRYVVRQFPERQTFMANLMSVLENDSTPAPVARAAVASVLAPQVPVIGGAMSKAAQEMAKIARELETLNDRNHIYARLPIGMEAAR